MKVSNTNPGKFSCTPLHLAAEHNHTKCAELLLDDGAFVDALRGEDTRQTALHLACASGYLEVTKLLLSRKADVNQKNKQGQTPLHFACKVLADQVIQVFLHLFRIDLLSCLKALGCSIGL